MAKQYEDRGAELGALIQAMCGKGCAYVSIGRIVAKMRAYARSAKNEAISECNFGASDSVYASRAKKWAKRAAEVNQELADLISPAGCIAPANPAKITVEFGGDPRGPCARLHIEGQRGDGWGDGFAIY
jgi:hypothetical protein